MISYVNHITVDPGYYQRNYKNDFPLEKEEGWNSCAQRAALIVIPFLSLYKPLGMVLSVGLGTVRSITHLWEALNAGSLKESAFQMAQVALAVLALAGTLLNLTVALVLTAFADVATSGVSFIQCLIREDYEKAFEEFLQVLSSGLYLVLLGTGNLEIMLIALLLQAVLSFYQARYEIIAGRYPEWAAKMVMGMIRCYQAQGTLDLIKRRNFLFSLSRLDEIRNRVAKGKQTLHLIDSPLQDVESKLDENRVILVDAKEQEYDFGTHVHGHGKGLVKGANLIFRTRLLEGKEVMEVEFKVNHVFRDRLETLIGKTKTLSSQELQETLQFSHSHITSVTIEEVGSNILPKKGLGKTYHIHLEGLGSLSVGASPSYPTLYDRVIAQLDHGKNLYDLHEMLSFAGLEGAVCRSTSEDMERLKIGHLFRTHFPKEALPLERSESFFDLPIDALKQEVVKRAPGMERMLREVLPKMEPREIFPGRVRYALPGLAEEAKNLGAGVLTSTLSAKVWNDLEMFEQTASVLKMGMLSSETRFSNGLFIKGISSSSDFYYGSADSVFTQLVSQKDLGKRFSYDSDVRFLFSLDLLETGTYQYTQDTFGERRIDYKYTSYDKRPGIFEFIRERSAHFHPGNEVMIKERIPPSMIQGIVVKTESTKRGLVNHLRSRQLIQKETSGAETILGIALDRFIHVAQSINSSMLV